MDPHDGDPAAAQFAQNALRYATCAFVHGNLQPTAGAHSELAGGAKAQTWARHIDNVLRRLRRLRGAPVDAPAGAIPPPQSAANVHATQSGLAPRTYRLPQWEAFSRQPQQGPEFSAPALWRWCGRVRDAAAAGEIGAVERRVLDDIQLVRTRGHI